MPASLASLLYTFMGLPLLVILVINLLGKKIVKERALICGYGVSIIQMISAAVGIGLLWQYHKGSISFSQFWDMSASANSSYFSVDLFSLTVLFSIGMVMFAAFFTGRSLLKEKSFQFTNLGMVLMLGMNGIALVNDIFSLYVFLEITGITSFILIAQFHRNKGLEGSFKYLVLSSIASMFILIGLALLFVCTNSLSYEAVSAAFAAWDDAANPTLLLLSLIFMFSGFAIKAGIVPFHSWLPDAYESAPASTSIMLGGIVTKMSGVYALIRLLDGIVIAQHTVMTCLMIFALVSIVYGAVGAIGQKNFKRILAYSSISQIGYIVLGATCGSVIGYLGAVLHFFNHATFKSTLFVNSAAIEQQVGTTDIEEMGGLQKQMPVTGVSSVLAFLSTAGIPPLAGFWSKLLIVIAAWQAFGVGIAAIALLSSILTAAYFLRLQKNVFFGPVKESLSQVHEAVMGFKTTQIFLSVMTVAFGILFPILLVILQNNGIL